MAHLHRALTEIWAEKARSLMQRSEPRDLYDLHHLLEDDPMLPDQARDLFRRKAAAKSLKPDDLLARLDGREKTSRADWTSSSCSRSAIGRTSAPRMAGPAG